MKYLFTGCLFFCTVLAYGQAVNAPLSKDYYHLIERLEVRKGSFSESFHASVKAYNRKEIGQFLDSLSTENFNRKDIFNYTYLKNDNWEWVDSIDYKRERAFLKHIYKTNTDFFNVNTDEFDLHVNPVLDFTLGRESISDRQLFINTRGVEIRGLINKKVGFYTFLTENQVRFPQHVDRYTAMFDAVPNEGFWKPYGDDETGRDFFTARGYISFQATKNINLQFGHDRFFIGNGERSMILSDFSPGYLFLKAETNIWKLNYTNIFGLQTANLDRSGNSLRGTGDRYDRKFMSLHHLSYNITKNLNVGIFEAIMSGDSSRAQNPIDITYLNPIIFYRSLEQQDGSSGNALVGMDFRWIFLKRFSMYGQFVLDEFLIENIRKGGWWANKYALQGGLKYFNAFEIPNLDLQAEYNLSRPFMYAHDNNFTNYANYKQSLAHPLGANFKELIGILRYQITPKLTFQAKAVFADFGTDTTGVNFGGNIFKANNTRYRYPDQGDFGHVIGQGESNQLTYYQFLLTLMPKYNLFIELGYTMRNQESEFGNNTSENNFYNATVRWNIPRRENIF
ncbi:capsule assembly Wzi family protein [Marivirga lumbricoides]|uniref:capsule assembly Wzi family protein n=1 Tax=Marivirga lumbricoides TaxID=1046115 RepID=UPI001668B8F4